jgi:hypothetical protein
MRRMVTSGKNRAKGPLMMAARILGDPRARQTNSDPSILRDRLQAKTLARTLRIQDTGTGEHGRD